MGTPISIADCRGLLDIFVTLIEQSSDRSGAFIARAFRSLVSFRASSKFYFIRAGQSNGKRTARIPRETIPARHSFATSLLTLPLPPGGTE